MLIATVNGVFALIFGGIAWRSIPRGLLFARTGWQAMRVQAKNPDTPQDIKRQRQRNQGTRFFLAGLGWLAAGIVSAGFSISFLIITVQLLYF